MDILSLTLLVTILVGPIAVYFLRRPGRPRLPNAIEMRECDCPKCGCKFYQGELDDAA
jgi:hypothetical protein